MKISYNVAYVLKQFFIISLQKLQIASKFLYHFKLEFYSELNKFCTIVKNLILRNYI